MKSTRLGFPFFSRIATRRRGFPGLRWALCMAACLVALAPALCRAQQGNADPKTYVAPSQVPSMFSATLQVLGNRLQTPGKEQIVLTGVLADASSRSSVQLVSQLGGKLRLAWTGVSGKVLSFDGKTAATQSGKSSAEDADLLESLVDDSAETLLETVAQGASFRFLGRGFPDPEAGVCDLVDIFQRPKTQAVPQSRGKRYCFDTRTALLHYVRYQEDAGGGGAMLETRFEDWRSADGQMIPGRITRTRDGKEVFQFQAQQVAVAAGAAASFFGAATVQD